MGPEVITLAIPEGRATYRVGVHYWQDNFYGPSLATLRVSIFGEVVHETPLLSLIMGDFWEALDITWPDGTVEPVLSEEGTPLIHTGYEVPCSPQVCPKY